jgi:excisionase family DNA binding protein
MSNQALPLVVYVTPETSGRAAFSLRHTADLLDVSIATVRMLVDRGQLHVIRAGRQVRLIPAWSIDRFLERPDTPDSFVPEQLRVAR